MDQMGIQTADIIIICNIYIYISIYYCILYVYIYDNIIDIIHNMILYIASYTIYGYYIHKSLEIPMD
jgi:hypothetical protein